jgi:hypothetical protein
MKSIKFLWQYRGGDEARAFFGTVSGWKSIASLIARLALNFAEVDH